MLEFQKRMPSQCISYKKVCGLELPMCIYLPDEPLTEDTVTVLVIHGGSWYSRVKEGEAWNGDWMRATAQYYAEKGFIAIEISYRSIDFMEDTTLEDLIQDCKDAIRFIYKKLPMVCRQKLIVMGDSAGGHLEVMMGISEDPFIRPYGVVAFNPVLDCSAPRWSYTRKTFCPVSSVSPIEMSPKECAKFLFLHGTSDTIVPIGDTISFHEKLKGLGHDSGFLEIPGARHAFILFGYKESDEYVLTIMKQVDEYMESHWNIGKRRGAVRQKYEIQSFTVS